MKSNNAHKKGTTTFAKLSFEAQGYIVNAIMGAYDLESPDLSNELRAEISKWCKLKRGKTNDILL